MKVSNILLILIALGVLSRALAAKSGYQYKMVTPPPDCPPAEKKTVFSPTGFLTFMVVAVASISSVVANINNNNDLNNNNNNNDNVNNQNQAIDSDNAMNMGNARFISSSILKDLLSIAGIDAQTFACKAKQEADLNTDTIGRKVSTIAALAASMILSDYVEELSMDVVTDIFTSYSTSICS